MQNESKDAKKICDDRNCPYTLEHHHVQSPYGSYIRYHVPKPAIKEEIYYADTSR